MSAESGRAAEKICEQWRHDYPHRASVEHIIDAEFAALTAERDALADRVHQLQEAVTEAESRANERGRRMISCCFCNEQCGSLEALKEHSATCQKHPLADRVAGLERDAERWGIVAKTLELIAFYKGEVTCRFTVETGRESCPKNAKSAIDAALKP